MRQWQGVTSWRPVLWWVREIERTSRRAIAARNSWNRASVRGTWGLPGRETRYRTYIILRIS